MTHPALAAMAPGFDWLFLLVALLAAAVVCVAVPLRIEMSRSHPGPGGVEESRASSGRQRREG